VSWVRTGQGDRVRRGAETGESCGAFGNGKKKRKREPLNMKSVGRVNIEKPRCVGDDRYGWDDEDEDDGEDDDEDVDGEDEDGDCELERNEDEDDEDEDDEDEDADEDDGED
jgi:hypothetical protein